MNIIPIEVSNRHVHLCQKDLDSLFGEGYTLTNKKELSQPGEFAAEETLDLMHEDNVITIRVIGPVRDYTQIEISRTDASKIKLKDISLLHSGSKIESPSVVLTGPNGKIDVNTVMIAKRHLHATPQDVKELGLDESVDIQVKGERPLVFKDVNVRVSPKFKLALHIDRDEGNAAAINFEGKGELLEG